MVCVRCNVENPADGKFCRSCGAPLGNICGRCGKVNEHNDRYCVSCGKLLMALEKDGQSATVPSSSPYTSLASSQQYSPQEIEELLSLRKTMKKEDTSTKTLRQEDVDKLFG